MSQLVVTLVAMLLVALASAFVGYRMAERNMQQAVIEATQRTIKQANEQAAIDADILSAASANQAAMQTKQRIIIKEVVRHVATNPDYSACKLDAYGMCLAQSAASGGSGENCTK